MKKIKDLNCQSYSFKKNEAIKIFLGSIINDRGLIQNKRKLFYNQVERNTKSVFKVIDDSLYEKYKPSKFGFVEIKRIKGVVQEFFSSTHIVLELPIAENYKGNNLNKNIIKDYLSPMAKLKIIDDLQYNILLFIFKTINIYYDDFGYVGFGLEKKGTFVTANNKTKLVITEEFTLENVLDHEIKQGFINKDIGDPNRSFGYTHLLRQHAKFVLTDWGKDVLVNWSRYNIIAASRGNGKTFLAALIAVRGLLDPRPGFGGRQYREIKYFVPNYEIVGDQGFKYMKMFIGDLADKKLANGKKAFNISKNEITCNITGNVLKIVSLYKMNEKKELGGGIGEGIAADLAIIDEASRIPNEFWGSFHQRAAFETQEFFIISTINKETPVDHWFYELLVDGETGGGDISSYRITIDMNEIMKRGKTEEQYIEELERAKQELRKGGDHELYAKGYCIILQESNVFNITSSLVHGNLDRYNDTDFRILGFDLGKLDDTAGLTCFNLTHKEIEFSIPVKNVTYGTQLEYVADYKKKYPNLLVIGDRSGVGEAVSEQDLNGVVDVWIKSTGKGDLKFNKQLRYYTCNKGFIVNSLATLFANNLIKIPFHNKDLIDQMSNFIKMKSGNGDTILYKGKGKNKDDLVLSASYAALYIYAILGLKTKEDIESYANQVGNNEIYYYNEEVVNNEYYGSLY